MRKMRIFTPKKVQPDISEGLKTIVRKKVLSKNGEVVGKVKDIVINNSAIQGVIVRKRFRQFFIDLSYIQDLYSDSVLLNIDPAIRYLGMQVFDDEGRKLGKVTDINQKNTTNTIESIVVRKNIFSKLLVIPTSEIEVSEKNIILNRTYE